MIEDQVAEILALKFNPNPNLKIGLDVHVHTLGKGLDNGLYDLGQETLKDSEIYLLLNKSNLTISGTAEPRLRLL